MSKQTRNVVSILLFVLGLAIMAFPFVMNAYVDWKQVDLLEQQMIHLKDMQEVEPQVTSPVELEIIEEGDEVTVLVDEVALDAPGNEVPDESHQDVQEEGSNTSVPPGQLYEDQGHVEQAQDVQVQQTEVRNSQKKSSKAYPVEGLLEVPSINLKMPILKGASLEHLNVSASSLDHTGKPWVGGNYAVAGHRSMEYGKHFNRLNEVAVEDQITVTDNEGLVYTYKVISTQIVHERDVWVLQNRGIKEITLITCDPVGVKNPDTRLVVIGELQEQN